jgi:predicted DNA-binding protein
MSTLSIRLPHSLHEKLKASSSKEGISMNQLITLAVAEKLAVLETIDYLEKRAKNASREAFETALQLVPDAVPESGDEWTAHS